LHEKTTVHTQLRKSRQIVDGATSVVFPVELICVQIGYLFVLIRDTNFEPSRKDGQFLSEIDIIWDRLSWFSEMVLKLHWENVRQFTPVWKSAVFQLRLWLERKAARFSLANEQAKIVRSTLIRAKDGPSFLTACDCAQFTLG
jgi:hypothetical protein